MNRDHLLGFAPIAEHLHIHEQAPQWFVLMSNPYGLGMPKRVLKQWANADHEPQRDPKLSAFENVNHALPNGRVKYTDAQLARRAAERDAQASAQEAHLKTLAAGSIRAQLEAAWDKAQKEGRDPYTATAVAARDRITSGAARMNLNGRFPVGRDPLIENAIGQMQASLAAQQNAPGALGTMLADRWANAAQTLREEVDADLRAALHIPF